jgi:hypothetical protein
MEKRSGRKAWRNWYRLGLKTALFDKPRNKCYAPLGFNDSVFVSMSYASLFYSPATYASK